MNEFEKATQDWENEVRNMAARLIERGHAPWQAIIEANQRVAAKRQGRPYIIPLTVR